MPKKSGAAKKWRQPRGPKNTPHKNKNPLGLGRTIRHAKLKQHEGYYLPSGELRFTTNHLKVDNEKLNSVTQETSLDEFLSTAELQDKKFAEDRKQGVKVIKVNNQRVKTSDYNPYLLTTRQEAQKFQLQEAHRHELTIPRRPKWDRKMTKFELEQKEKDAFLEWRRQLAILQQNNDLLLTPFERNLNLWKQLWRVVEQSDLVVQIVDARNPLLFRSGDLAKYVKEEDSRKRNLLLVNKADLLTLSQRRAWGRYFQNNGISYTFFSAAKANEILEKQREEEEAEKDTPKPEETPDSGLTEEEREELAQIKKELAELEGTQEPETQESQDSSADTRILTVAELEALFLKEAPKPLNNGTRVQIGLVGYPNVGKSSTINALVGSKKVSVSSTPGKTKHYQTILLSDEVMLCDCPGLVFPNFAYTNAELVCNGILPIDQLRESTGPSELVCRRIPQYFLEALYGIKINTLPRSDGGSGIPTARELLTAYAKARGYMTSGYGSADQNRAARYILKDYVNGKLLYVEPPPHEDGSMPTEEESFDFNKELYTLKYLPERRQAQVLTAMKAKGIDNKTFDLSKDFSKLDIDEYVPMKKTSRKKAIDEDSARELDQEFFQLNNVRGVLDSPFHQKKSKGGKKHNKQNRQHKKKERVHI